ncbi:Planctomycete cytochrome C [Pirellula sp. SH-Sr6A]|uniref:DUF1553 domain-containing protein n=1 Tax=Pirellula sp. SH-Sr6A TaxID=1632865 RepID=UPI00078EC59F|nr:DUF1553 domain-containing protein [Pirellula sp. SH-Sr6A]AMV31172.1 Planctomycete cytochrome C [Pirellula sp. SH-Sr6A]
MNRSLPPHECWTRWAACALAIFCCFSPGAGGAQDAKQSEESNPVVRLDFESETTISWTEKGSLIRDQEGPRPPEFPDFSPNNHAIRFQPGGAHLIIADTGKASRLDFGNDDRLSIEAWVQPDPNSKTSPMMVVGKGRTGNPKFAKDNQNWALRLVAEQGEYRLSFLFSTGQSANSSHWHRWTSNLAFEPNTGWHHIAVTYRFGEPDSVRGWIDGQPTDGKWDMGGKTKLPPIEDDDDVWVGTASVGNQYVGLLDGIALYRSAFTDAQVAGKFQRLGGPRKSTLAPEVVAEVGELPAGKVQFSLHQTLPKANRWLNEGETFPSASTTWTSDTFFLKQIPQYYDDWGIRDDWKSPLLLRAAGDVRLPPGDYRVWIRARGLSRLWIQDEIVARTGPVDRKSVDGEQAITPVATGPYEGVLPPGYHQQEAFGKFQVEATDASAIASPFRVIFETIVGGPGQRTETGEILVAIEPIGGEMLYLLTPNNSLQVPLTEQSVAPIRQQQAQEIRHIDQLNRRERAKSQDAYWSHRHGESKKIASALFSSTANLPSFERRLTPEASHPIDRYLHAKIESVWKESQTTDKELSSEFHNKVLPILRDHCFRCHGDKDKGGLRLHAREDALKAGESENAAVKPGNADESELILQIESGSMPPTESKLSEEQIQVLRGWINNGAHWPPMVRNETELTPSEKISDLVFLRRASFDTIGLPPSPSEIQQFLADSNPNKRKAAVERYMRDPRFADHWMSFWQDLLAENPTLLNQSMGSTGPFRWFLYEALVDQKPLDRMVTELILMRGSSQTGGSAAFALAGESDSPMAAKAGIISSAFLGIDLQCARCHDSPYHSTKQRDLYALAAMLDRKATTVPKTSRVPDAFFEKKGRESLIKVTLRPDESIARDWPFGPDQGLPQASDCRGWQFDSDDSRDLLAAIVTAPQNKRFPRVFVNRIWMRLMGAGLVEPADDWEGKEPSHPELLDWLANRLVQSEYDWREVVKEIMLSDAYQRQAVSSNHEAAPAERFFLAPDQRRLSAEQIVDALHHSFELPIDSEELTFVHDGQRTLGQRQTLGVPTRAWMFTSLNNERDRPSLSLPRAAAIVDVLEAFGWTGSRQKPISQRDHDANLLQPGMIANGVMVKNLTRSAWNSPVSRIAIEARSPEELVDTWYLRILNRLPTPEERTALAGELAQGFDGRVISLDSPRPEAPKPLPLVTWFNHLVPETSSIQLEHERRVVEGPSVDPRLSTSWREVYEDFLWTLVNQPELVWYP